MKKSKGGYMILECILGTVLLGATLLMVLQTSTVERSLGEHQSTKVFAHKAIKQFQNNFQSGMENQTNVIEGIFPNGQPYELCIETDKNTNPPLEKAIITFNWNDLTTNKHYQIEGTTIRIR